MHGRGGGYVAGEEDVEGVEGELFQAGVQVGDFGGGGVATFERAVGFVVAYGGELGVNSMMVLIEEREGLWAWVL